MNPTIKAMTVIIMGSIIEVSAFKRWETSPS